MVLIWSTKWSVLLCRGVLVYKSLRSLLVAMESLWLVSLKCIELRSGQTVALGFLELKLSQLLLGFDVGILLICPIQGLVQGTLILRNAQLLFSC